MAVIGIDVDGVLAHFTWDYIRMLNKVSGRQERQEYAPPTWNFEAGLGFTERDVKAAWKLIRADDAWWRQLGYVDTQAPPHLYRLAQEGHSVYFITARAGVQVKTQTEQWLVACGYACCPTVLISDRKDAAWTALQMDCYIDDRLKNANLVMRAVRVAGSPARVYLQDASYNRKPIAAGPPEDGVDLDEVCDPALIRVSGVAEMLKEEGL